MPFDQHHESIDISQKRLGELEPVDKYEDVWKGKVDKAQDFCDRKAAEIEDDTVIDEGLAKMAVILENAVFEGAKEKQSEVVLRNLMTGLERNIEKIESGIEVQEMYQAARELLGEVPERTSQPELPAEIALDFDLPQFEAERMYGFAETPSEHQFQQLVDSMQTDEEKKAFLTSITKTLSEADEIGIEVTEQQHMRMEQLQLFSMMMQMFVTEFGDDAKFLGSQVRNKMDETMGIDTRGTAAQFKQFISKDQLEKYQYQIMLDPHASLKDIIPAEAFRLIEMRTTLPPSQAQTEGLYTVAFRDPKNPTELHEKKQNILNWFRFYSHYGEVSAIIEEDLKAEITAAINGIEATELLRIEEEVYQEIEEMKSENLDKWRSGYEGPGGEWVPAMTEQQIKYFVESMEDESREQKKKQYALKEKFDPSNLSSDKRDLWEIYNDTFDPKDQVTNLADSTWDTIRKELIINVPLIMASGGLASLARQAMSKAAVWTAGRMGLLTGLEIAYESSRIVKAGAFVGLTLTEGVAFEAVHSMALKQLGFEEKWLAELNLPQAMQRIFWSTVTLGLFHGAGKLGQGFGKSIDQAGIKILGEAARKVTDSGTRRLLQEVLIAGNMEAFTMLLMGAVQTGIYEGSMEAFWEQMTSHEAIFHAYLAAYSLKAGHHATRTFAPITSRGPSKRKTEQRDKPNPEGAGAEARAGGAREFVQGEVYITSRGNAEVLAVDAATGEVRVKIGEGENARVETVRQNELQRMVAEALGKAMRPEQAGARAEKITVQTGSEVQRTSRDVGRVVSELGFQEIVEGQAVDTSLRELDRAYIQNDITNDVSSPRGASRQAEAFKRVAAIREGLTPAEKALPRAQQNAIISARLRETAKIEGWNAGNVSANIESFLQAKPDASYRDIMEACFPPELQAYFPRDLRFSIKQDVYVILNKREAIRKHTDGVSPSEAVENIFGFKPEGEVRMFRDAFTLFFDFANPIDYVRANNPNLRNSSDAARLQQQVNFSQHGRAFEASPNTKISELDGVITIGNNTIGKGKFEETLMHEREHQLHRVMRTLAARNEAFMRMRDTQMPTSNALEITDLFIEGNRQALTQAQTEILAFLVGGKDSTSTINELTRLGGAYDFSRHVREKVINEYKAKGDEAFAEYVEIDIGGESYKLYQSQVVAYTQLAEYLLMNAKSVGGERAMASQLAATKIHNWSKVFSAEWAAVVEHSILPLARNNLLFAAERARQSQAPIDLKLLDVELRFYEKTYGLKREQLIVDQNLTRAISAQKTKEFFQGPSSSKSTAAREVADYLGASSAEAVNVGTGSAAIVPPGVEIGTRGIYGCLGVFVRGPKGNALIHMTPGTGFSYDMSVLGENLSSMSPELSKLGPLSELEVTIVHNAPIANVAEGRHAEVQGVRSQFEQAGFGKVALAEVPFTESGIHFDPSNPGQISVVGKRTNFNEKGETSTAREINYEEPVSVQLGVDHVINRSVYEYSLEYPDITVEQVRAGLENGKIERKALLEALAAQTVKDSRQPSLRLRLTQEVLSRHMAELKKAYEVKFPGEELPSSLTSAFLGIITGVPEASKARKSFSQNQAVSFVEALVLNDASLLDAHFTPEQKRILIEDLALFD